VQTFQADLAAGTLPTVVAIPYTDVQGLIERKQLADITDVVKASPVGSKINPEVLKTVQDSSGKIFGLPVQAYTMSLNYNRALFKQAGLDPDTPPATWADVVADAKKIAALGNGTVGYADYSAGNTGGWHFTAEMYSQGGHIVSDDGKKADFNNAAGLAVINNLKQMRWTDNDMGSKQLLQYNDTIEMMAGGKLGMTIGAPDYFKAMQSNYKADLTKYGMGAMPAGANGSGTLLGGDGYMFNKNDTPDQIKAGLLWLEFENLTPGKGQFNYERAKADGVAVGLPEPDLFQGQTATTDETAKSSFATLPVDNFKPYIQATPNLKGNIEPPQAQAIYKVLDGLMSAVLTDKNADPQKLLDQYSSQVNSILANAG